MNSPRPLFGLFRRSAAISAQPDAIEPVELAYASYENTRSYAPGDAPPPLVVMHGLLGSKGNWNGLCKAFHQKTIPQRKVVAVDARNHGDSPHAAKHTYNHLAEDLRGVLKRLGAEKAALLGHSMGGRAMMLFALKYPQMTDKLIVADISPVSTSSSMKSIVALFSVLRNVALPKNVPMSSARLSADLQMSRTVNDKGLRAFLLTNLVQQGGGSYGWRLNIPALVSNFHKHIAGFPEVGDAKFEGPVLFLGGGASDFIQKTDHPHIKKMFPNAEFVYISGAGHWLHSEKPAEFLQICTEFLNRRVTIS